MTSALAEPWRVYRDFDAAAAARDDDLADDDPLLVAYFAARKQIITARPADVASLAVQLKFYRAHVEHSLPLEAETAMFDHVIDQLTALAAAH